MILYYNRSNPNSILPLPIAKQQEHTTLSHNHLLVLSNLVFHYHFPLSSTEPPPTFNSSSSSYKTSTLNDLLAWSGLGALPETCADDGGKSEEDTEGDAQTPDSLHQIASRTIDTRPSQIVDLVHIRTQSRHECSRRSILGRRSERRAVEITDGLTNSNSHDDNCDQEEGVGTGGDQKGEGGVVVENVGDCDVEDCDACLFPVSSVAVFAIQRVKITTERVPTRTLGGTVLFATMSAMKLAVIPMIEMSETACIPRITVKVIPKAPCCG